MNLYINCSPKLKNSNSNYFTSLIKNDDDTINYIYKDDFNKIINNINIYKTIIFIYPLYMDTFPSKLIEFIETQKINFNKKNIYVICNCGFLEYKHNLLSLDTIEYYINKNNGVFKGYLNIGCGEIIGITKKNKILKFFCKNFYKKIKYFKKAINNNNNIKLNSNIKWLNKYTFCLICNHFFKKRVKNNY